MKPTDPSPGSTITEPADYTTTINYITEPAVHHMMSVIWNSEPVTATAFLHEQDDRLEAHSQVGSRDSTTQSRSAPIARPPGEGLIRWVADFFSPETAERRFGQLLADMGLEYRAALSRGRHMQARWIVLRGWAGFVGLLLAPLGPLVDGIEKVLSIIEKVVNLFR